MKKIIVLALFNVLFGFGCAWAAPARVPNDVCFDKRLTPQDTNQCVAQIAAARTVDEQKQIQAKFRKRATEKK